MTEELTAAQYLYSHASVGPAEGLAAGEGDAPGKGRLYAPFTLKHVLAGHVVHINPALITLTDGIPAGTPPAVGQQRVLDAVQRLIAPDRRYPARLRTVHADINFPDYSGYGEPRPIMNDDIFSCAFLHDLARTLRAANCFLNIHLLTDDPAARYEEYERAQAGCVCFQLEVLRDAGAVAALVERIVECGACASPVIETVGSASVPPLPLARAQELLAPSLPRIGMLTFQAAGTTARSDQASGECKFGHVRPYVAGLREGFKGTVQIQGGITTATVREAVGLGAEFLVAGTQLFRNKEGRPPKAIIAEMLREAAAGLEG